MTVEPKGASAKAPARPAWLRIGIARAVILVAVIGLSLYIFSIRDQAERLAVYGYPGIFLVSLLSNATILLPAPGVAFVFAMGGVFKPALVALAAALGATGGEIFAYAAGFSGQGVVERTALYDQIVPWMRRFGGPTTLILATVPNPFFDLAGIAAGALRMRFLPFLLWCFLGKTLKMLAFAYSGAQSIGWLDAVLR